MKFAFLIALGSAALLVNSCNTVIGISRDMRMGGEGLEKVANKASSGNKDDSSSENTSEAPVY